MEIEKIKPYDLNKSFFKYLIDKDSYFDEKISKIYIDILNKQGKLLAHKYHLSYFESLNKFLKKEANNNDQSKIDIEDIEFIKDEIEVFFDRINDDLNIKNKGNFEEFQLILELSELILGEALEQNRTEPLYESIFQIESKINEFKLCKEFHEFIYKNEKGPTLTIKIEDIPKNQENDPSEKYHVIDNENKNDHIAGEFIV